MRREVIEEQVSGEHSTQHNDNFEKHNDNVQWSLPWRAVFNTDTTSSATVDTSPTISLQHLHNITSYHLSSSHYMVWLSVSRDRGLVGGPLLKLSQVKHQTSACFSIISSGALSTFLTANREMVNPFQAIPTR